MAKQLNVSLSFTADANAAKREIQSLQQTLNNLAKFGTTGLPIGNEVLKLNEDLQKEKGITSALQSQIEALQKKKTQNEDEKSKQDQNRAASWNREVARCLYACCSEYDSDEGWQCKHHSERLIDI